MESNQIIAELRERGAEALQAATALAQGLEAIAEPSPARESSVRSLLCPQCWAPIGRPCTLTGPDGEHLARWLEAERRGVVTRNQLAAVIGALDVVAAHVIVRGAR